jgi:hypothetical protein
MRGLKTKSILFSLMSMIVVSGMVGAVYACPDTFGFSGPKPCYSYCSPGCHRIDLKIMDQDEWWSNGVTGTWTTSCMAPGDEFAFDEAFISLKNTTGWRFGRKIMIGCDYNSWSDSLPDHMAKYMEIDRCTYRDLGWQIDCLTGKMTRLYGYSITNDLWCIRDVDGDGRLTFYDLKKRPLTDLPLPFWSGSDGTRFEMSVRFNETAGNEFQGNTFTLDMIYTFTPS